MAQMTAQKMNAKSGIHPQPAFADDSPKMDAKSGIHPQPAFGQPTIAQEIHAKY